MPFLTFNYLIPSPPMAGRRKESLLTPSCCGELLIVLAKAHSGPNERTPSCLTLHIGALRTDPSVWEHWTRVWSQWEQHFIRVTAEFPRERGKSLFEAGCSGNQNSSFSFLSIDYDRLSDSQPGLFFLCETGSLQCWSLVRTSPTKAAIYTENDGECHSWSAVIVKHFQCSQISVHYWVKSGTKSTSKPDEKTGWKWPPPPTYVAIPFENHLIMWLCH